MDITCILISIFSPPSGALCCFCFILFWGFHPSYMLQTCTSVWHFAVIKPSDWNLYTFIALAPSGLHMHVKESHLKVSFYLLNSVSHSQPSLMHINKSLKAKRHKSQGQRPQMTNIFLFMVPYRTTEYLSSASHFKEADPQAKLGRRKMLPAAQRGERRRRFVCEVQNFLLFHRQAGVNGLFMGGERRARVGRCGEQKV